MDAVNLQAALTLLPLQATGDLLTTGHNAELAELVSTFVVNHLDASVILFNFQVCSFAWPLPSLTSMQFSLLGRLGPPCRLAMYMNVALRYVCNNLHCNP